MSWFLEITDPSATLSIYELEEQNVINIGREEGEILIPHDPAMSSLHLRLIIKPQEILWDDLQTTNGTFHRNLRKKSGVLLPGDQLIVGSTKLNFSHEKPKP